MQLPTSYNIINISFDLLPFSQETEAYTNFCQLCLKLQQPKTLTNIKYDGIILYSWLHEIIYSIYVLLFVPSLLFSHKMDVNMNYKSQNELSLGFTLEVLLLQLNKLTNKKFDYGGNQIIYNCDIQHFNLSLIRRSQMDVQLFNFKSSPKTDRNYEKDSQSSLSPT